MKGQSQFIRNNRGQGTIEYILLVMVVLVMLGFARQFNEAFGVFVKNYYESYLTCLLETGELPTLGYEGAEGDCNSEFQPFSLANGRPPRGSNFTSDGGGSTSSSTPSSVEDASAPNQASVPGDVSGGGSGESGGGGGSSTLGAPPSLMARDQEGRSRNVPLSSADGGSGGGNVFIEGGTSVGGSAGGEGRPQFVAVDEKNAEEKSTDLRKRNVDAPEGSIDPKAVRIPADVNTKKKKVGEDEGWSLPDFMKFIVIAILVIIMLVFFGGQALSISKGSEK